MTDQVNLRFGKNARMEIAPWNGGTEPAADQFTYFCSTNEIKIGSSKGTETVNNFCTGGNDVEVNDGSEKPTLSTGDATWTEKDRALQILENAYDAEDEDNQKVWYRIYPLGKGAGKSVFRGVLTVKDWELTLPSKGTIKMKNTLSPMGTPEKGTVDGNGKFTAAQEASYTVGAVANTPVAITGEALTSGTASNLPDAAAGQAINYAITTNAAGDLVATTTGTSAPRTITILDGTGTTVATGQDSVTLAGAVAGQYTVSVAGTAASTGGTVTVTHS